MLCNRRPAVTCAHDTCLKSTLSQSLLLLRQGLYWYPRISHITENNDFYYLQAMHLCVGNRHQKKNRSDPGKL